MKVGFVSTRLAGTDGVSLETAKLATILERIGHQAFYCAGELDPKGLAGMLVPEMHFAHPRARSIHDQAFAGPASPDLRERIAAMAGELEEAIRIFVDRFSLDVLFAQNALAIPMHLPLGVALTNFIAETGIPTIAHHHDFYWERDRFSQSVVEDIIERCFPPVLPSICHLTINSLAREALRQRKSLSAWLLPNIFDFEVPPPRPDLLNADLRETLRLEPGDWLILQPTRVVPRKGIELSIELLRQIGNPRCKLLITHHAGDEGIEYLHHLQDLAKQVGVDLRYAAEWFNTDRRIAPNGSKLYSLWDAYVHADLVTYPSLIEGFGNALLETIYFQVPALVNRYPVYVADIAPLGFHFVEVEGAITPAAVAGVRCLLEDAHRRQEMTTRNFALGRRHFSYTAAEAVLRKVLGSLA